VNDGTDQRDAWRTVDDYLDRTLGIEDDALREARTAAADAGIPDIAVTAPQGAFLALLARATGARRVLEIGTLAGYSTICLARGVGPSGSVTTLEVDERHADVAVRNFERAGVGDRVELVVGPAGDSLRRMLDGDVAPYDLVFIDADKPSNPLYVEAALGLTQSGAVIVLDNVVRRGAVADADSDDVNVIGTRAALELLGRDDRVDVTALQMVGAKGWDGFALAVVR
jgi:predicted O-methyltransferase YrrM